MQFGTRLVCIHPSPLSIGTEGQFSEIRSFWLQNVISTSFLGRCFYSPFVFLTPHVTSTCSNTLHPNLLTKWVRSLIICGLSQIREFTEHKNCERQSERNNVSLQMKTQAVCFWQVTHSQTLCLFSAEWSHPLSVSMRVQLFAHRFMWC